MAASTPWDANRHQWYIRIEFSWLEILQTAELYFCL